MIDLGFGNPDIPSPPEVVEKLCEAAQKPRNHRYSSSRGIPKLRQAICDLYERRFGVDARSRDAGDHDHRRQGGPVPPDVGAAPAGRHRRSSRARATRSTSTRPVLAGADVARVPMGPERGPLRKRRRDVRAVLAAAPRDHPLVPAQPDDRDGRPRVHAASRRLRARARGAARARLRLCGPRLRRLPAALDPPGRGRRRGRGRALHAHEVVLDGRLARRVPPRERGGRPGARAAQVATSTTAPSSRSRSPRSSR